VVKYGQQDVDLQNTGYSKYFEQGEPDQRHGQWIHRANMTDLEPGTEYFYMVSGEEDSWSETHWFTTLQAGTDWSPRLAVYGDLGSENAKSLPLLANDTLAGMYDAVLHVGDFAYDMNSDSGRVGDQFMRLVEPVAGFLPYMTCPGNHEVAGNFSNYKERFSMPGDMDNLFFSFDMGPVHFVSVSSEVYYYPALGYDQILTQYNWLRDDLQAANEPSARSQRPWVVVFGHRPMYCTNIDLDDCDRTYDKLRVGLPGGQYPGLEELLMQFGVDLAIWAHEHSYERLYPVYNYTVYKGSEAEPYVNPGAPVHVTSGSAGCKENHNPFFPLPKPAWSAFRSTDYGFSRLAFHNASHMSWEQVSTDRRQNGQVIDSITIVKEVHGAYSKLTKTPRGYL